MKKNALRLLAHLSVALWLLSLALPSYFDLFEYLPGVVDFSDSNSETHYGFECLLLGWWAPAIVSGADPAYVPPGYNSLLPPTDAGAFLASFAWYANILWAWNLIRVFRGRRILWSAAVPASLLALASLEPVTIWHNGHGMNSASAPLIGIYIWALAIAIPLFAAVAEALFHQQQSRSPPLADLSSQ